LRNLLVQTSAIVLAAAAGVLAGVLRLLAGLLATALLLAGLVVLAALLMLAALVLVTLVLSALMLTAALLAGIVGVLGVLIHHVLSCCPCPTIERRLRSKGSNHDSINTADLGTSQPRRNATISPEGHR
jgi:uncharacterized protein YqhQ